MMLSAIGASDIGTLAYCDIEARSSRSIHYDRLNLISDPKEAPYDIG